MPEQPRAAAEVAARIAAIGLAPCSWIRTISRQTMSAVTPDLAGVGAGRERHAELDGGLDRGALAAFDHVLALALDRGQAAERPVDVGHDERRNEEGAGGGQCLDGGSIGQPGVLDAGHAGLRRPAHGLGILGVAHDLDAELGGGLHDRPQLVERSAPARR